MYRQNRSRSYTDAEAQGQGAYGRLRLGPSAGRVSAPPSPTARGSFMVDARRSHCPVDPGSQPDRGDARTDGWQVIQWRKNWSRLCRPPPPPPPHHPVPTDLVDRCFNFLPEDYVTVPCIFPAHYLRCRREGRQAHRCKRPRSSDSTGPPPRPAKLDTVAMQNP
jgi:hypothetical protein